MRTRLLGLTVITLLVTGNSLAQVLIHPLEDQLPELGSKERALVTNFVNSYPIIGMPRIGESSKETTVMVEKYGLYNTPSSTSAVTGTSGSCSVTVTTNMTVIKVDWPDVYTYQTQTVKMAPADCGEDSKADLDLIFGKASRVMKTSVMSPESVGGLLADWTSWSMSGKTIKYLWTENQDNITASDSGVFNLGASNFLCADSNSLYTEKGYYDSDEDPSKVVKFDYKQTTTNACQAARPIFAKIGTDVLSLKFDENTEYCAEDFENDVVECHDTKEEFAEGIFPEELLPKLPSLNEEA